MNRREVEEMIITMFEHADYDLSKQLDPDLAEEPEFAEDFMQELVDIAANWIDIDE